MHAHCALSIPVADAVILLNICWVLHKTFMGPQRKGKRGGKPWNNTATNLTEEIKTFGFLRMRYSAYWSLISDALVLDDVIKRVYSITNRPRKRAFTNAFVHLSHFQRVTHPCQSYPSRIARIARVEISRQERNVYVAIKLGVRASLTV